MATSKIRILVVDDSAVARQLLIHLLQSDPELEVVATANNGLEALEALQKFRPDVVTMDVQMPGLDGFETTRRIMENHPVPVIIVSGTVDPKESAVAFQALEAGALAILERPAGVTQSGYAQAANRLIHTVKAMSEVRVIRRWKKRATLTTESPAPRIPEPVATRLQIVAIGISTGGPPVLQTILSQIPNSFPVPILIVQHISAGFLEGLAEWLTTSTGFPVHIARNGEPITGGRAYLAPDGFHMGVDRTHRIKLSEEPPDHGLRPSASHLFRSVEKTYGRFAVGILLTGMGRDGAEELKLMRDSGALTIAQDKESSIVHGMPGEAIRLGAAVHVLPPAQIAATLRSLVRNFEALR